MSLIVYYGLDETIYYSAPCSTFSPDISLMAAGFAESYIRIWSLKGEKLKGLRSGFQASSIRDGEIIS
jgi:transcription initiation factor TFIID subunit 5